MEKYASETGCMDCHALKTAEWQVLERCELAEICKSKRVIRCNPGETIYSQGEPGNGIYCISSGLIGLRRVDINGNSVLVRLVSAGTTFGYRTFLTGQAHINSAEALTPSVLCYIKRPRIESLLKSNPLLSSRFMQHFFDDSIETENDYVRSLTMGMRARFLHVMLVFYKRFGYRDEDGNAVVELPIKRGELAELVGVRPESISRLIDQLQTEELMSFQDRRVRFADVDTVLLQAGVTI